MSVALSFSYDVALPLGAAGGLAVILPALLQRAPAARRRAGGCASNQVDNVRYHAVTAASSLLCGLAAAATGRDRRWTPTDAPIAGLMSFLAALTAQLVVLPLVVRDLRSTRGRGPPAS